MAIEVRCGGCGALLRASDSAAGRRARCPECGDVVQLAAPGGSVEVAPDAWPNREQPFSSSATHAAPKDASATSDERPCPMCGTKLKAIARRCRFCGEDVSQVFGNPQSDQASTAKPMTGLVLGISAVIFFCIWLYSVPIGIAAIVVSLKEIANCKAAGIEPSGMSTGGVICGVFVVAVWTIGLVLVLGGAINIPLFPF